MNHNLPKVFTLNNNTNLEDNNVKKTVCNRCYEVENKKNINQIINDIFNSNSFVYKKVARVDTIHGSNMVTIVGKSGNYLVTLEQGNILINDITNISI